MAKVNLRCVIIRGSRKRNKLTFKAGGALRIKLKIGKTRNNMVRNVVTIWRKPGFAGRFFTTWGKSCNLASSLSRTINYFRLSSWMWTLSENEHFRFSLRRIIFYGTSSAYTCQSTVLSYLYIDIQWLGEWILQHWKGKCRIWFSKSGALESKRWNHVWNFSPWFSIMEKILPLTVALLVLGLFMTYFEVTGGKCWEFNLRIFKETFGGAVMSWSSWSVNNYSPAANEH